MLELVLLAGKVFFLVVLYLFVFLVIRSAVKDLRTSPAAAHAQSAPLVTSPPAGGRAERPASAAGAAGGRHAGWELVVTQSRVVPVGTVFALPLARPILIGRAGESDIQLRDTFVSSRHARLVGEPEGLRAEDLGSTNGVLVNGADLERPMLLGTGDQLAIGDTVFRVEGT